MRNWTEYYPVGRFERRKGFGRKRTAELSKCIEADLCLLEL